jgi:phospholipase/carboxylesterase
VSAPFAFGDESLELVHRVRRPLVDDPAGSPPALLLLHGVGSDERDLLSLAPMLDPRFLILSVRSPVRLEQGGYGWYRLTFTPRGPQMDEAEAAAGLDTLGEFVRAVPTAYGAAADRVYLTGFSQGAIMSLALLLAEPELVAGAALMSGRLLPGVRERIARPESRLAGKPVVAVHGLYDQVLPISDGRAIRELLSSLPVQLTYREFPMAHEVSEQSFAVVRDWLTERLGRP